MYMYAYYCMKHGQRPWMRPISYRNLPQLFNKNISSPRITRNTHALNKLTHTHTSTHVHTLKYYANSI